MKLTILGSGTYQPELKRHSSSYLLQLAQYNIVLDFGRGVLDQLLKLNISYHEIDNIFISHLHADHCSELGAFLHIALGEPRKGKKRKKNITIYGPKGITKTINHLLKAFNLEKHVREHPPKYNINIIELKSGQVIRKSGWAVEVYKAKHTINGFCYRIKSNNKILAYSGDTEDCTGLRKACKNADLAIVETSWPKSLITSGHLSGEKVGEIASACKVKKLALTHLAPYYLKHYQPKKEVAKYYSGPIVIARDLMEIKI